MTAPRPLPGPALPLASPAFPLAGEASPPTAALGASDHETSAQSSNHVLPAPEAAQAGGQATAAQGRADTGAATPLVIGLDLSITCTGIAGSDGTTYVAKPTVKGDQRLVDLRDAVLYAARGADLVVIEDLPTHAHGAGITGMVHGAIRTALRDCGTRYVLVVAASLKKYATGKGNCGKTAMALAALDRADLNFGDRHDECDAWWLRAMGLDALGHPVVALPKTHRAALAAVTWPEAVTP